MDCLYAKCELLKSLLGVFKYAYSLLLTFDRFGFEGTPCITDCVMAELEKLGQKYRVALR